MIEIGSRVVSISSVNFNDAFVYNGDTGTVVNISDASTDGKSYTCVKFDEDIIKLSDNKDINYNRAIMNREIWVRTSCIKEISKEWLWKQETE